MNRDEAFEEVKKSLLGEKLTISSIEEAEKLHVMLVDLSDRLRRLKIMDTMPHYRGEQKFGWDIHSKIFRKPPGVTDPKQGKALEKKAVKEFEKIITEQIGATAYRDLLHGEKFERDWDLLFQAQQAGINTTITDWTAEILNALFFATEKSDDDKIEAADGQLWCFITPTNSIVGADKHAERQPFFNTDPFDVKATLFVNPATYIDDIQNTIFDYRMYTHEARFITAATATCNVALNKQENLKKYLLQVTVPFKSKHKIRKELANKNLTSDILFLNAQPKDQDIITEINKTVLNF